ncbi:phasin [Siculibacillus lacustris]|uniref:Phasin n=1 Tax=Siculibacillus lacustris TaxID=1549641 RepID=A0A4V2KTI1_9HYPH|nr:phasin [Siculibacillus lacustris]TBW37341.1 phasin [Siculibacillus lacustris]
MATDKTFEIPEQIRTFAEKSVEQAKKAVDDFIAATHEAVAKVESSSATVQNGALDLNKKVLSLAEQNLTSAFEHAQKLIHAKDPQELLALQSEFLKAQAASFGEQVRQIGDAAAKTVASITEKATKG